MLVGVSLFVWRTLDRRSNTSEIHPSNSWSTEAHSLDSPASRAMADRIFMEVIARFPDGWSAGEVEDIAMAVQAGVPVLAATGYQEYYSDLDGRGFVGSESRIRARYEQRISSPRWKELVDAGRVEPPSWSNPGNEDMVRLLVETNHLYFDDSLASIEFESVVVREGGRVTLNAGEQYTMVSSMSDDWNSGSAHAGILVEFDGTLVSGRKVRVCLLIAKNRQGSGGVWGIASCALVASGRGRIMHAPF